MLADLPRARRRPRPPRQEGPARLRRVARPARRASRRWDSPFGPGRPGWHIECTAIAMELPRRRLRRAGRRQRPGLPAPRDVRRARPRWPTRRAVRAGLRARRHGRLRRREDVEVARQPGLRLRACATATSTRWRSGWRCCATTTARTGSGPTTELWDAVDTPRPLAPGAVAGRRRARPRRSSRPCWRRWPTTSTPRRAVAAVDAWVDATLGTDGLADTSDPDAAPPSSCDAASAWPSA